MKRTVAVLCILALAACGKATETAAEKMIESSIAKDGTQAKVNLSEGGMKVTTTDASGKTTQMEMGNAKISEADLGLPFYPGAKPTEGSGTRIVNGGSSSLQLGLHSDDAPDKVAGYYRDKLKAQAQGRQFTEMSAADAHTLMLADDKSNQLTQVTVAKGDGKGSDIQIMAHRTTSK